MTHNYFTSKATAQKTMKANSYKKVSGCSDNDYNVALYTNALTGASAVLKVYKNAKDKESDTLVKIFENSKDGKTCFEIIKGWMK